MLTFNPLDFLFGPTDPVVAFGGPKMQAAPVPQTPTEDPAAAKARADAANQATLEAQTGGRRSNIFAGAESEEGNVVSLGGKPKRRGTGKGASADLGMF
jgi:hypothetical protein